MGPLPYDIKQGTTQAMPQGISIVTVSRNRTHHLQKTAYKNSLLKLHAEHVIVDWGSTPPILRADLPHDTRIKLYRCDSASDWWLTQSYNFGFALASQEHILKLDADCAATEELDEELNAAPQLPDLLCNRLTLQDWALPNSLFHTSGAFVIRAGLLKTLRGFNPHIRGWGWDEIDLFSRAFLAGATISRLPGTTPVEEIQHDDSERLEATRCQQANHITRRLLHEKNRLIALACVRLNVTWQDLNTYREAALRHAFEELLHYDLDKAIGANENRDIVSALYAEYCSRTLGKYPFGHKLGAAIASATPHRKKLQTLLRLGVIHRPAASLKGSTSPTMHH